MNALRTALHGSLVAVALILVTASAAPAATPHEQFLKALGKIAPFAPKTAKRLCACTQFQVFVGPSVGELRPGFGTSNGQVDYTLVCEVPTFNEADGSVQSTRRCPDDLFEILPRK
jgi:hypothetical protein